VTPSDHVCEQDFALFLTRVVPNGKDMTHLCGCKACVAKLTTEEGVLCNRAQGSAKRADERRHDHRFVTQDFAVLQIVNPFSVERFNIRLVDISKNGLGLHMQTGLIPGSLVQLRIKDYIAFGESRYCLPAATGFFVGIQIHDYISLKSVRSEMQDRSWPTMTEGLIDRSAES
jgi:hypothetical protein